MNDTVTITKKTLKRISIALLIVAAVLAIYLIRGSGRGQDHGGPQAPQSKQAEQQSLGAGYGGHSHGLPARVETKDQGPVRYAMSEEAKMLAEVQTIEAKREHATKKLRMVGMVFDAETRVATLTARIDGRLDGVYIDYTGVKVEEGDPMVKIWSPTLIKSEVELFESMRSKDPETGSPAIVRGAEEKLMQYGMTKEQVEKIKKSGKPDLYIALKAPISGIVMKKMAVLGQFVKEGQDMFVINDLSHVWVLLVFCPTIKHARLLPVSDSPS